MSGVLRGLCRALTRALSVTGAHVVDVSGDVGGGFSDGVAFEMGIAGGRAHHAVAEQIADHRQGVAERERPGGIPVA